MGLRFAIPFFLDLSCHEWGHRGRGDSGPLTLGLYRTKIEHNQPPKPWRPFMTERGPRPHLTTLRARIARIEGAERRSSGTLPFGLDAIDRRLPGGGLALGALHEVAGGEIGRASCRERVCQYV